MLSFERKLETSDGLMFAGNWEDNKEDLDNWLNEAKPCLSTAQARQSR